MDHLGILYELRYPEFKAWEDPAPWILCLLELAGAACGLGARAEWAPPLSCEPPRVISRGVWEEDIEKELIIQHLESQGFRCEVEMQWGTNRNRDGDLLSVQLRYVILEARDGDGHLRFKLSVPQEEFFTHRWRMWVPGKASEEVRALVATTLGGRGFQVIGG